MNLRPASFSCLRQSQDTDKKTSRGSLLGRCRQMATHLKAANCINAQPDTCYMRNSSLLSIIGRPHRVDAASVRTRAHCQPSVVDHGQRVSNRNRPPLKFWSSVSDGWMLLNLSLHLFDTARREWPRASLQRSVRIDRSYPQAAIFSHFRN